MKSKYLLLFIVLFISTYCVFGQLPCDTDHFPIDDDVITVASGCDGSQCILDVAQTAAQVAGIANAIKECDLAAAFWCNAAICTTFYKCVSHQVVAPTAGAHICIDSLDSAGNHHFCKVNVSGTYKCSCGVSTVFISTSGDPQHFCPNTELILAAEVSFTNINYYQWILDDSLIDGASDSSFTVASPGTYRLMVADLEGAIYLSDPLVVQSPVQITLSTTEGCSTSTATAIASGGLEPYAYHWSTGASTSGITVSASGVYTVTATDLNGCFSGSPVSLTVHGIIATIFPAGTISNCAAAYVVLTANEGAGISYQWKKGTKNVAGATNQTYFVKSGAFKVFEANSFGCSSTSPVTTINKLDAPPATITPLGSLDICGTNSVVLQANAGTGYTYQWEKGNIILTGQTNQTYTAISKGSYKVIVTNSSGCTRISGAAKVTRSCKEASSPQNSVSPEFSLYPNPTDGNFTIDFKLNEEINETAIVEVSNVSGQIIYTERLPVIDGIMKKEIPFSPTANGIYLVKVIVEGKTFSEQLNYQK